MNDETKPDAELFNSSYERCQSKPGFLERFDEIFLGSSPEVAEKFRHTDFARQHKALKASLYTLMLVGSGKPEALQHLERLAQLHSRKQLNIRPELYDLWLSGLLKAVGEFDRAFDEQTEGAWRRVLQPGIDYMKAKY